MGVFSTELGIRLSFVKSSEFPGGVEPKKPPPPPPQCATVKDLQNKVLYSEWSVMMCSGRESVSTL
jgi:hypothetical protein